MEWKKCSNKNKLDCTIFPSLHNVCSLNKKKFKYNIHKAIQMSGIYLFKERLKYQQIKFNLEISHTIFHKCFTEFKNFCLQKTIDIFTFNII